MVAMVGETNRSGKEKENEVAYPSRSLFGNLRIRTKLLIVLVFVAVASTGVYAVIEYRAAKQALLEQSFSNLTAVRELKAQQIEDYFDLISNQIVSLSESQTIVEAMQEFQDATSLLDTGSGSRVSTLLQSYYDREFLPRLGQNSLGEDLENSSSYIPGDGIARVLQDAYIARNRNPTGEKHLLDDASDGTQYSAVHKQYHPTIRSFLERFGYYDIFLVDAETGRIVYSVFKEVDFGTSLLTGPYADTNFAEAFRSVREAASADSVRFEDFAPYAPSYNAPASFVASPIFDEDEITGVLVFQMPIDRINNIMTSQRAWSNIGLGASGETYIVGEDLLMRNQSRFLIEDRAAYLEAIRESGIDENIIERIDTFNTSIGLQAVDTVGTRSALASEANTDIFPDYRGVKVLSAYRPLDLPGLSWVIMSEIDEAEALLPAHRLRNRTLLLMSALTLGVIVASFLFARTMTRPIQNLTEKAKGIAQGDLGITIDTSGGDEIAQLARNFDAMRQALRELIEGLETKVEERTKELSDSEVRARSILNNAADSVIVIDGDGIVREFNPSAEATFGYKASEVIGGKIDELMPDRHARHHDGYLQHYHDTGEKRVVDRTREVEGLRKDGTEFPLELHVGEAVLEDEKLFVGIIRDITERRLQEKEIADNLSFVTTLVDSVPNPIFVKDTSGRYLNFNTAYENAFGVKREDIIGKSVKELDFFPEEYRYRRHEEDLQLLRDGGSSQREASVILGDGKEHDMLFWARAFDLSDGSRGGVLGVFVDITEQKELERQLAIANKRMGDELNIGRQIQMSMIPLTFPRFPEHKDLDVWAYIRPAREVGGDFYDFFMIDDRYFAFVIADVSGKGVPAALMMAVAKTLLKSRSQDTRSTENIISATNNELSENNDDCMFITAFFAIIDTMTGEMTYTNAGHNPPYLVKTDGSMQALDQLHGPMVGVMPGAPYGESQIKLDIDDKIVLYTDGVTEAFDVNNKEYGEGRLEDFIQRSKKLGTKHLVESLVRDVDEFVGEEEQSDDITVFCLRYVAWEVRDARGTVELRLVNDLAEIDRCLEALEEICRRFELPAEIQNAFSVVLDDLLNNVINYAYKEDGEHPIDVVLSTDGQRFIVSVTDEGIEFDPFMIQEPDIDATIDERQIGGLGIHLIRNLMDDHFYRRDGNKNVTTLMKRIQA
jgi:PAS domain S-box-containing protein